MRPLVGSIARLIDSSNALREICEKRYEFSSLIESLSSHATALTGFKLPGSHVRNLTVGLVKSKRPIGQTGAFALLKKLEGWHLLPPLNGDPATALRKYRAEVVNVKKMGWEHGDWSEFHPVLSWAPDEGKSDDDEEIDKNYKLYIIRNCSAAVPGYKKLKLIGNGVGGLVFQAVTEQTSEPVAIKIFPISWTCQVKRFAYFENNLDSRLAAIAEHSALLVTARQSGFTVDGDPYIVMNYVEGKELNQCKKFKDICQALTLWKELATVISALHRQGLIFLDFNPANILVQRAKPAAKGSAHLRLLDYDLLLDSSARSGMATWDGEGAPPGFGPPEAREGVVPNFRFDVYGLSAILYRMLTGKTPRSEWVAAMTFRGLFTEIDDVERALQRPLIPPSHFNKKISKGLDRALLKGLALNPSERYQDADLMLQDFHNI